MSDFPFIDDWLKANGLCQHKDFLNALEKIPVSRNGELCGVVLKDGTEIHLCPNPEFKGRVVTRKNLLDVLTPLMEINEFLTTRLLVWQEDDRRFIERLGFQKTWSDGMFNYFILTEVPYAREER